MEENELESEPITTPKAVQRIFPVWITSRRKFSADNTFFSAGNLHRELVTKQITLDFTEEEKILISRLEEEQAFRNLFCPIAGCGTKLKSLADFEAHHVQRHMSKCSVCLKIFPTTRLLNMHVSESHDSFFHAKVARGFPMYECFVEGCGKRFQNDSGRKQHLVDLHQFPRSFSFQSKKHLSQGQRQQHKRNAYKQAPEHLVTNQRKPLSSKFVPKPKLSKGDAALVPDVEMMQDSQTGDQGGSAVHGNPSGEDTDADMEILTAGVSRLSTASQARDDMPVVVSFGRRRTRGSTMTKKS